MTVRVAARISRSTWTAVDHASHLSHQRLSASLSNSTLASLFKRSPSPSNTAASPLLTPYGQYDLASPATRRQLLSGETDEDVIDPALQPHAQHDEQYQPLPSLFRHPVAYLTTAYHNLASLLSSLYSAQLMSLTYLHAETKRNYRGFIVGLFTVLLVVAVIALIQNNTLKSPIIFFKVAENSVGETDLVLTPGVGNGGVVVDTVVGLPLLNQSWLDQALTGADGIAGTSGRWLFFTRILSPLHMNDRQLHGQCTHAGCQQREGEGDGAGVVHGSGRHYSRTTRTSAGP